MEDGVRPADVAIIGIACRFPGAANPAEFWRVLRDGKEVTRVAEGKTRREGLLDNVAEFDADFFNVSPREAGAMDPRQRLALELAWELLEDAFLVPEGLRGEQVAVYLGAMSDDYAVLTLDSAEHVDHHSFAGISRAMIANRISYALGLYGPSMTIDAGQSSSLVSVHAAAESLRSGESKLAIAGGVHLNLASETSLLEREFGALSEAGHTYAFDGRADGYVRSEGGGLVLLKPLRAALEDGDRIRAVIRGSAVGNAGHTAAGQTAPSVAGQADVIRRALGDAGLQPGELEYVEAHGTGTPVGDPVEANALGEAIGRLRQRPLTVGSVKTNIGHAGGAAGIAGLLKAVLSIENGAIPASLNYAAPTMDLESLRLRVSTELTPWPAGEGPRRAGVSSFGMGGTNAHVIVEQAPARPETPVTERENGPTVWVLSGRSQRALANQAARLHARVAADPGPDANDVAWSLATTRSVFEHRAALVGTDRGTLAEALAGLAHGEPRTDAVVGRAHAPGTTAFVFPGQGAQSLGMGAELYGRFPVFAEAFDEAAAALDDRLRGVMWGSDSNLLDNTEFAQQALFAVQVGLAALLRHWGVVPDVVMGHSVGEITAAHVAGVLSLSDAAKVVAARGRLMAGLPAGGAMVAVGAGEGEVAPLLTDGVAIAAINGPEAVVISGSEAAVGAIIQTLADRGRRFHRLAVSHAFHSPLMEPMIETFEAAVSDISPEELRIPLVSNVSGQLAGPGYGSARYWAEHVRRPVRFADGVRAAESFGAGVFVEVGPGGGLSAAAEQSLATERPVATVTLAKDRPEVESLLMAAARLFTTGVAVDWSAVLRPGRRVELPTYGFVRQRFWLGSGTDAPAPDAPHETAERLRQLPPRERRRRLTELVCAHAAAVLGHPDGHAVDPERAFQDLGFDSLTGVELRNRLKADTGLALSRTLIFDYPNPATLADHLGQQLLSGESEESDEEKVWSVLRKIPIQELRRTGLLDKLLLLAGDPEKSLDDSTVTEEAIDSLSPDALIALALDAAEGEDVQ
ncbi:polyketide synthase [Mycobacterium sp. IEC1808]|nr:polyketide synthase [Mycobacterium sp. IEC1808]